MSGVCSCFLDSAEVVGVPHNEFGDLSSVPSKMLYFYVQYDPYLETAVTELGVDCKLFNVRVGSGQTTRDVCFLFRSFELDNWGCRFSIRSFWVSDN